MKRCTTCNKPLINCNAFYLHPDFPCQEDDGVEIDIKDKALYDHFQNKYGLPESLEAWEASKIKVVDDVSEVNKQLRTSLKSEIRKTNKLLSEIRSRESELALKLAEAQNAKLRILAWNRTKRRFDQLKGRKP